MSLPRTDFILPLSCSEDSHITATGTRCVETTMATPSGITNDNEKILSRDENNWV
jgi:hypothetical protein